MPDIRILLTTSIAVAAVAGFAVGPIQGGAAPEARSPDDPALAAAGREMDALAAEVAKAEAAVLADGAGLRRVRPRARADVLARRRDHLDQRRNAASRYLRDPGPLQRVSEGTKAPSKPGSPTPTEL